VVVVAQNLLMKKLGPLSDGKVDTVSFDRYVELFAEGLIEQQAELIASLFTPQLPVSEGAVEAESWANSDTCMVVPAFMDPANILVWKVRDLNGAARHDAVRALVAVEHP
jgi:hypothetical protein